MFPADEYTRNFHAISSGEIKSVAWEFILLMVIDVEGF